LFLAQMINDDRSIEDYHACFALAVA
jgi:hypothetical protein